MCVICVSRKGVGQPSEEAIRNMFNNNRHGAGYMFCKDGQVVIRKGFPSVEDYLQSLEDEKFGPEDLVIYHFRISTQARRYEMTQPFPLTNDEIRLQAWDDVASFGVAHNGIIAKTSNGNPLFSDTALYIRDYLYPRIKSDKDITSALLDQIQAETGSSKIAILSGSGKFYLTGQWIYDRGLLYSNDSYQTRSYRQFSFLE